MLTKKDIAMLMDVFPTRPEVEAIVEKVFDEKMSPFQDTQQSILSAVDKLATAIETQNLENAARDAQLSRPDMWIRTIAGKTSIKLKS